MGAAMRGSFSRTDSDFKSHAGRFLVPLQTGALLTLIRHSPMPVSGGSEGLPCVTVARDYNHQELVTRFSPHTMGRVCRAPPTARVLLALRREEE